MRDRTLWLAGTLSVLFLCLLAVLPPMEGMVASFPEVLLGQVVLSRESKPLSPPDYQSAEFVLNQVGVTQIEQAFYIGVQEDVLFWEPAYTGFSRTRLSREEIRTLQGWLASGDLFYRTPDGSSYQCVIQSPSGDPKLETCAQGKQYMDRFMNTQWEAEQYYSVGVLQFHLSGRRLAEIRVYRSISGVAYVPFEKGGDWWLQGITVPLPLLDQLASRLTPAPVPILWPEKTADAANARAARILGDRYKAAVDLLQNSPRAREVLGDIQEVRPAAGINSYSSWMDSTSVFLTLRVLGARGEGAVIIQGYDCFDIQMVFEGRPVDAGPSPSCP